MQGEGRGVAVVTGANRGLGHEAARQLGKQGYKVVLTARDGDKAHAAANELQREGIDATGVALDVTDPKSVEAAARTLQQKFGRVDVLVNNAGISGDGYETPASQMNIENLQRTLETNTYGPLRVTQAFMPMLKKSDAARVVNVSSGMGQLSDMGQGAPAYRISKTALNALTRLFAMELQDTTAKVNSVCPGWVRTDMGSKQAPRSIEEGARGIVWAATLGSDGPTGGFFRDGKRIDW